MIVLVSFFRFLLRGNRGWLAFVGGVALSLLWFPIGVALLDWAIAKGPGPRQPSFYVAALGYVFRLESLLFLLLAASFVILGTLLGFGAALLPAGLVKRHARLA